MAVRRNSNGGKSLLTIILTYFLVIEFCCVESSDNSQLIPPENPESTQQNDDIGFGGDHDMDKKNGTNAITDHSAEEDEEAVIRKLKAFREKRRQARSASQVGKAHDPEFEEERRRYEAAERAVRDVSMQREMIAHRSLLPRPCL